MGLGVVAGCGEAPQRLDAAGAAGSSMSMLWMRNLLDPVKADIQRLRVCANTTLYLGVNRLTATK